MATAKQYLKVNTNTKTVTIDKKVTPTADDKELLNIYVSGGYKVRFKSEKRAEVARERAKKTGFGKKKEETK